MYDASFSPPEAGFLFSQWRAMLSWVSAVVHLSRKNGWMRPSTDSLKQPHVHQPWSSCRTSTTQCRLEDLHSRAFSGETNQRCYLELGVSEIPNSYKVQCQLLQSDGKSLDCSNPLLRCCHIARVVLFSAVKPHIFPHQPSHLGSDRAKTILALPQSRALARWVPLEDLRRARLISTPRTSRKGALGS